MIRRNLNRRVRSSKAMYNRVMESIAPKVKRAILNESKNTGMNIITPVTIRISENAACPMGTLEDVDNKIIYLGPIARDIIDGWCDREGIVPNSNDYYHVKGNKDIHFNARIKIYRPSLAFFGEATCCGDPSPVLVEFYDMRHSDETVYTVLLFENGKGYMFATDSPDFTSNEGFIEVKVIFEDKNARREIFKKIKNILASLQYEYDNPDEFDSDDSDDYDVY